MNTQEIYSHNPQSYFRDDWELLKEDLQLYIEEGFETFDELKAANPDIAIKLLLQFLLANDEVGNPENLKDLTDRIDECFQESKDELYLKLTDPTPDEMEEFKKARGY